jgi:hypothetical protein
MTESAQILTLNKEIPKKHAGGRPKRILTDTEYDIIERACAIGLTQEQIAKLINCSYRQFCIYVKKNKRIKDSWQKGKLRTDLFVAGELLKKIKEGNISCIIFYMKTKMGWSGVEKQEIEYVKTDKSKMIENIETKLFGE